MKPRLIILFAISLTYVTTLGERTPADIELIINSYTCNSPKIMNDDDGLWNQIPNGKEISLTKAHKEGLELDSIETALLSIFDDIIINSTVPNGYFLKDSDLWGVAKLDGTIVVPPVPGKPRRLDCISGLRVGDLIEYSQVVDYFMKRVGKHINGYAGIMSALLDENTLNPIIPFGAYDYILYTTQSYSSYYYVGKEQIDNNNEAVIKWGYLDSNGNEIIPCRYRAIIGDDQGNRIGSDSIDMFSYLSGLDNVRANFSTAEYDIIAPQEYKLTRSQKFWIKVADKIEPLSRINVDDISDFLASLGEGIIRLDESLRNNGIYDTLEAMQEDPAHSSDESVISSSTVNDTSSSSDRLSLSENQSYNTDKRTYANYDSMLSAYYAGVRNASSSEVSQWKQNMKRLRTKWESKGKSFPHSENENK